MICWISHTQWYVYVVYNLFRNRAIHGDVVAVEILPRSQWTAKSNALADENAELGIFSRCLRNLVE